MSSLTWKTFDFRGIEIPYRPAEVVTLVTTNGNVTEDILPPYIVNLQKVLETGSETSMANALTSMDREILLACIAEMRLQAQGWEAPIAISGEVPAGHVFIDKWTGRIVLNEAQAIARDIDADGDRGELIFSEDKSICVLIKWPLTDQPLILKVMKDAPKEKFRNFTRQMLGKLLKEKPPIYLGVNASEEELFLKKHADVPVGLITSAWNVADLWNSEGLSFSERCEYLYNSFRNPITGKTLRAEDIEDRALKAARKMGKDMGVELHIQTKQFGVQKNLDHPYAWALTSCSSIAEMEPYQLSFIQGANLPALAERILNLEVEFRPIKDRQLVTKPKHPPFVEDGLISRLINLGLLRYQELPHVDPNLPPACIIWLTLPDGTPVALTDVKRENREEGLTYAFVVGPVFDNSAVFDDNGKVFTYTTKDGETISYGPSREWVHPINALAKAFFTFDSTIRPWKDGPISHYFPRNEEEWANPLRKEKIAMLQKLLIEWMGKYGDPAPAHLLPDGGFQVTSIARATIRRTVVVDYGRPMSAEEMYQIAKLAQKSCNFSLVGSKGTDRRVRRYMLANEHGASILDTKGVSNPYRGGCQRAQLQRALKAVEMNVAFVAMSTQNGCYITPKGVKLQETTEAFLPQVFNSEEAYLDYLSSNSLTTEKCPATLREYWTWTGHARVAWIIGSKDTIRVGKLVCPLGQKFMPRLIEDTVVMGKKITTNEAGIREVDQDDVHLIIPVQELVDKDMHHILRDAEERHILIDGESFLCLFMKYTFYRTGAASENIPPRWRGFGFRGMDSMVIQHALQKIGIQPKRRLDFTFAEALQSAKRQLTGYSVVQAPTEVPKGKIPQRPKN